MSKKNRRSESNCRNPELEKLLPIFIQGCNPKSIASELEPIQYFNFIDHLMVCKACRGRLDMFGKLSFEAAVINWGFFATAEERKKRQGFMLKLLACDDLNEVSRLQKNHKSSLSEEEYRKIKKFVWEK